MNHMMRVISDFRVARDDGEAAYGFDHGQVVEVIADRNDFVMGISRSQLEDACAFVVPLGSDIDGFTVDVGFGVIIAICDLFGERHGS